MTKCKDAVKYKGIHKPKCGKGTPCAKCLAKYKARRAR